MNGRQRHDKYAQNHGEASRFGIDLNEGLAPGTLIGTPKQPLAFNTALISSARAHSQDMLARGYFAHVSPQGEDLGQRLKRARVSYLSAGENLALAPTLHSAHTGLMHSPGHRANILRPQFGRLGVGILDAGSHGLMVTQAFRN